MKNKNSITWIVLMLLTIITAFLIGPRYAAILILLISAMKFLLVAFQFMELKKAHSFWKVSMIIVVTFVSAAILVIL
ncbi:cytochrome C oxidase subunit IV family protein [Flavihumibacter solisilvae]|uniref:cytochrome C oxidase subunit IV family protein n=1 Tax=Flavihumibacter solisilvae TaxID=1349421 RepID=UPI0006892F4F|nr:cytochrome C oxidase subunit IV family protein [Flavihumibacter solisilvae]